MCKTKENPIATKMNFNIRILYWKTPQITGNNRTIMTQRNTQINLSHQLAVMIFPTQLAMEHFGLLSPRLHTHLYSIRFYLLFRDAVHGLLLQLVANRKRLIPKPVKNVQFFKVPFLVCICSYVVCGEAK